MFPQSVRVKFVKQIDMKKKKKECVFDIAGNGYITISRKMANLLANGIVMYDEDLLYCMLLIKANYGDTCVQEGKLLHRGEIIMTPQDLSALTSWKKTKVYATLDKLKKRQLLESVEGEIQGCYRLPMYEEHCGRTVRPEERKPVPAAPETETESSFLRFFDYYHFTTRLPRKECERARREWKKLSLEEREEALQNVFRYKEATLKTEHLKLACNYLKDKSFKF